MVTENVIAGILFFTLAMVSTLLFVPRLQKFARWAGSRAPMSVASRICVTAFFVSISAIAFTARGGVWIALPVFIWLCMYICLIADRRRFESSGKR